MPRPGIGFNIGQGGLGRPRAGEDHFSAMLFFNNTLPSGFGATDRIKKFFSLKQAEDAGIAEGSVAHGVLHYHISEFFRLEPKGVLWVGIYAVPVGAYDFAEVELMVNFAEGKIRQFGTFIDSVAYSTTNVELFGNALEALEAKKPAVGVFAGDISAVTDLTTLTDLKTLTSPRVHVTIGQDGGATGAALAVSTSKSVTQLGATLGSLAKLKVSQNIGWVGANNISNGIENDVAAFANGDLFRSLSDAILDAISDLAYGFCVKDIDSPGTFFNDSLTAIAETSDFSTLENNRTMDKARREIRASVIPALKSPVRVNGDGQLSESFINYIDNLVSRPLDLMQANDEIGGSEDGSSKGYAVTIDPTQDVLATSEVVIQVDIIPLGSARFITFNIGFTAQIN